MNSTPIAPTLSDRFWRLANPKIFMGWSSKLLPWIAAAALASLCSGLIWGYFFTPDDMRQGSTVKIIYLHVPAALMAINGYLLMFVGALVWLIRRQHVSVLAAKAAAPVGMVMTLIALVTGAIWG
jgi:heme exporter protein C